MPVSSVGQPERHTQNRVIALFCDELGYRYLDDWSEREGNSNIQEALLTDWLLKRSYTQAQIGVALHKLRTEADNHTFGANAKSGNALRMRFLVVEDFL